MCVNRTLEYTNNGHPVNYVELFNEQDHASCIYISPTQYNSVVKFARSAYDAAGLAGVKIIGPGTASIEAGAIYVNALDSTAAASLYGWSVHAWDASWSDPAAGPESLREKWVAFGHATNSKDSAKPVYCSEYATWAYIYNGVEFPSPDTSGYSASDTVPFAARIYENTLSLANLGVGAPIYWEARDPSWGGGLGLCTLSGQPRPVFNAMRTLTTNVSAGSRMLTPSVQQDKDIYSAAFYDTNTERLVVGMANNTSIELSKQIIVSGLGDNMIILQAKAFLRVDPDDPYDGQVVSRFLKLTSSGPGTYSFIGRLPAESTLTVVLTPKAE